MQYARAKRRRIAVALGALLSGGCYGGISGVGASGGDADDGGIAGQELPAPTVRFFRLTHTQWENTVADLFYLDATTGFSDVFRADPSQAGFIFDNNAIALEVDQALWGGYQRAAGDVAELISGDPTVADRVVPTAGDDATRAREFITNLGRRAYRRPLQPDEIAAYVGLFDGATDKYENLDPFTAGVRIVIESMLQSPHFLYRVEWSAAAEGEVIPLDGNEVAQRMSYFLWNTMPDDALFAAADDGLLDTAGAVEEQARRMLADPRAEGVVDHFHHQLLEIDKIAAASPSPTFFPDVPPELGQYAVEENQRFVREIILERGGTLADLLTSNETYVNDELAQLYGLEGDFGSEFELATLDPTQRRGIFTQIGFLAANSSSVNPDPIHRGVFVAERMTCTSIAAPPDGVPPVPPVEGKSNRQTVEDHTEAPGSVCTSCHGTIINPFGFPYEHYDATGAFRTEDNGFPVDAASEVFVDGERVPVANALELADVLAQSESVHQCYLRHWLEFAQGRPHSPEDEPLVERLGAASASSDSIQDVLVSLVVSTAFRSRATEEMP